MVRRARVRGLGYRLPLAGADLTREARMNKKLALAWLVVFIAWFLGSFVVHGVLLHDDYKSLSNLFRPEAEAQQNFPLMILAHILMSAAFACSYPPPPHPLPPLPPGHPY